MFFSSLCAEEEEVERRQDQRDGNDCRMRNTINANHNRSLASNFHHVANNYENQHTQYSNHSSSNTSCSQLDSKLSHPNSSSHNPCYLQYTPRSNSNMFSSAGGNGSGSGSDEGGYAGSASSNDAGGGSSSTSCSSYDHLYNGKENEQDTNADQVGVNGGISSDRAHAPLSRSEHTAKRIKNDASFSSDLADFSSSTSARSQHYHGDDGHGSGYGVAHGSAVGTKTTGLSSDESDSDSDGEEYNYQLRQQRRRYQPKQQRQQQKRPTQQQQQQHYHQQQQPTDTCVPMKNMRRGTKRRNVENTNFDHAPKLKKTSQQQSDTEKTVLSHSSSSTTTVSCNSNSTFSPRLTNKLQEKQHEDLKATFQSALKQLDHTIACSSSNLKLSSPSNGPVSSLLTTTAVEQQATVVVGTKMQLDSDGSGCDHVHEMESRSSNTSSSTHNLFYNLGADVMACIMSYLEPDAAHTILEMPLSKTWRSAFTLPQDLWKVLCLSAPFHAKFDGVSGGRDQDIDEDWLDSHHLRNPLCSNLEVRRLLGRYRMLYSSFIKCLRYLNRIKDDVLNHRTPLGIEDSRRDNDGDSSKANAASHPFNGNSNLKHFFAKAREVKQRGHDQDDSKDEGNGMKKKGGRSYVGVEVISRHDQAEEAKNKGKPRVKYGHSKLTQRLLGPVHGSGVAGHVDLPWSCAIYSVVNWMVAFTDVAGIQNMCLKILPDLLEDEKQRTSAQHAGLTDIVLRAMVLFPCISELHTAAFHTLVLLARPLGGKEGMLFHRSMVKSSGIFNVGSSTGKSGIAVMLDSMKRFSSDEDLQAMGCWSMVNIALIPSQKVVLVKLGGISVAANAIMQHPHSAEVHFRALFALINLVIPSENLPEESAEAAAIREQVGGVNETSEKEMLDESVGQITNLVVVSMKNFWSSEAILNRACLVLHNLSLNESYHRVLIWTPNCYQMLEWCIGNYRRDAVLQQSAGGTLQRLQMTLANDVDLRQRFAESIRVQQQYIS